MAESRFVYVIYIRTTAAKLWKALLEPEFTKQFWIETWQESEWTPGSDWRLMRADGGVADSGKVLEVIPEKRLVLTWQNQFMPEMTAEGHSRMTYELEPVGESIKLTVTHEMDRPESKLIGSVSQGWPHLLSSLKSLLETGESLVETRKWPEGL
jgi:uncharacterized protein YndB with AHSA1/START domain